MFAVERRGKGAGGRRVLDESEHPYLQKQGPDSRKAHVQVSSPIGMVTQESVTCGSGKLSSG